MADSNRLREAVERAVLAALDEHVPALRDQIIATVLECLARDAANQVSSSVALNAVLATLHQGGSQAEILSAMLDGAARFSGRVALFVVRGAGAQGWQARGLPHDDAIKTFKVDVGGGLAQRAMEHRAPVSGAMKDFDPGFATALGVPAGGSALVLPLIVRGKVAALVYADAGLAAPGTLDGAALEIIVRTAGSWIELAAVKKAGSTAGDGPPAAKAAAASAAPVAAAPAETEVSHPPAAPAPAPAASPSPPEAAPVQPAHVSPEDDETHRKAKRFAKLLVEEIKLYNQAKVGEGRQKGNLYELLKDDIEKSRASYEKRYGQTLSSADYFSEELIRILADGNESLLGSNIPR